MTGHNIDNFSNLRPDLSGVGFPTIPSPYAARILAVLFQLEQSQWWSPDLLRSRQFAQLEILLRHAWDTSSGYRLRLESAGYIPGRPLDEFAWSAIPILTRSDLQQNHASLASSAVPQAHGALFKVESSGSTGRPVQVLGTDLTRFFWQVTTLRDHFWQQRDFSCSLFSIRPDRGIQEGAVKQPGWGSPVDLIASSGPMWLMHSSSDLQEQFEQLCRVRPDYLLTLPSNLRELAQLAKQRGIRPVGIGIRTFGESVGDELRGLVQEGFGVPLVDIYSASEVGYMALQCPQGNCYHTQSETVLLEVLDDEGKACPAGGVGRVVATSLHNFALPLIRYEVGDYAEVGEPCSCGRGLPTLKRILGRVRGMAITPEGRRFWPSFPAECWMHIAPIRQVQLLQTEKNSIEVTYAMERELHPGEEQQLTAALHASFGYPYRISYRRVERIERSGNGKFEDFISALSHYC